MKLPALIVAALVVVGLTAAGVATYANLPHHASCLVLTSGGHQQLYFGSPGTAGASASGVSCQFQFLTAPSGNYVRFSAGQLDYDVKLSPFTAAGQIQGADALLTAGGNTLRCHVTHGTIAPGGIFACSFGFWQLLPKSDGVVVRFQRGSTVSTYQFTPASLPHGSHGVFW